MMFLFSLLLGLGSIISPFDASPGTPLSAIVAPVHHGTSSHGHSKLHALDASPGTALS